MNKLNREKIHQAIAYLEWKISQKLSLKIFFALIYFTDRYHLRKRASLVVAENMIPSPEGYTVIDEELSPINLEVAHHLGLHLVDHDRFIVEDDLVQ